MRTPMAAMMESRRTMPARPGTGRARGWVAPGLTAHPRRAGRRWRRCGLRRRRVALREEHVEGGACTLVETSPRALGGGRRGDLAAAGGAGPNDPRTHLGPGGEYPVAGVASGAIGASVRGELGGHGGLGGADAGEVQTPGERDPRGPHRLGPKARGVGPALGSRGVEGGHEAHPRRGAGGVAPAGFRLGRAHRGGVARATLPGGQRRLFAQGVFGQRRRRGGVEPGGAAQRARGGVGGEVGVGEVLLGAGEVGLGALRVEGGAAAGLGASLGALDGALRGLHGAGAGRAQCARADPGEPRAGHAAAHVVDARRAAKLRRREGRPGRAEARPRAQVEERNINGQRGVELVLRGDHRARAAGDRHRDLDLVAGVPRARAQ
jgi:hypothetical protein